MNRPQPQRTFERVGIGQPLYLSGILDIRMPTYLETLIDKQVQTSVLNSVARTTDRVADELAQDLLRDPEFRETLRTLIKAAFAKTLRSLQDAPPSDDR